MGVMISTASVNSMLDNLEEEDYKIAVSFIQYLSDTRKKKKAMESKKILAEIQEIFSEDKGWNSEESMIKDMVAFRKERMSS
jgi:aspartate-semialdehyde dehydrogenase